MAGRDLLRVLTCGSVDDGKSTLIGRLLFDCQAIMDDAFAALERDSRRYGTVGEEVDLALLLDGLEAERQQGITIDVAYRYFGTPRRNFIIADCPGHEQYTRNMATGASNAELAIILVDARKGLTAQTRRHTHVCALMGIRQVVLAVNKMDLVGHDEAVFQAIATEHAALCAALGVAGVHAIPLSGRYGDNVVHASPRMPWYGGPTLLAHLEAVDTAEAPADGPFRLPVQWVNRPNQDFRGFAGTIAGGTVAPGDTVVVAASGRSARVSRVYGPDGDRPRAAAGEAVTICLDAEIDIARGDVLTGPAARCEVANQFSAHLLWMDEEPLLPGREYALRIGHAWTTANVTAIKHRLNIATQAHEAARQLAMNEIGQCSITLAQRLAFDAYAANRRTGGFILVDRLTGRTAGCGMIDFALRRASNIHPEAFQVDQARRAAQLGQKPRVIWFTGLSGSGKSTLSNLLEQELLRRGRHTYILDGDNLRHGLNRDLGFTAADRVENIRRAGEVARLMADAGLIVLCSFISPFRADREMVRAMMPADSFVEVFVDTPLALCEERDAKGLYAKARRGELPNFTGVGSPYEPPVAPELHLDGALSAGDLVGRLLAELGEEAVG